MADHTDQPVTKPRRASDEPVWDIQLARFYRGPTVVELACLAGSKSVQPPARVVVTGIGVIAPTGIGKERFWRALLDGVSGITYISRFDCSLFPCQVAGEVSEFQPSEFLRQSQAAGMARFSQFAVAAARLAADDARLHVRDQPVAVAIGTSVDGHADVGEASREIFAHSGWQSLTPSQGLEVTAHAATSHVQRELGLAGPVMTLASACCTGIDAIAWGADQIRVGNVGAAIVGASESPLIPLLFALFTRGNFLSTWVGPPQQASRPYDLRRSGLVLSEGAAVLVLEELHRALARCAPIYAEVRGYASAAEPPGSRHPHDRYALALQQAITLALRRSRLTSRELDYICAHGNSTPFDDAAEVAAHRAALGDYANRLPISSIKSMIGQPLAAGGALQAAATALALQHKIVPPTINLTHQDPDCDLDHVPNTPRVTRLRHALLHSHSLGGQIPGSHSAMVLSAPDQLKQ